MDTLDSTFAKYFGPTEDTHGTGCVVRLINGILTSVIVDQAERDAYLARIEAETKARNEHEDKLDELMQVLNE